jgi:hypothetical protein
MGFITLGIETASDVGPEKRKTSVGVRVYLWSGVLSVFVFLPVEYYAIIYAAFLPRGTLFPPVLALSLYGPMAILSGGSLAIGFRKLRRDSAPRSILIVGKILGAFVMAMFALSVIGCGQALMALAR